MEKPANYLEYNREAWNHLVRSGNRWTIPVSEKELEEARNVELKLILTPTKIVPADWYPAKGSKVLGLASGGGQQGPLMAAAGFEVTIFDNSPEQLAQDRKVAESHGLNIRLVQGDMADLSVFPDGEFDMVFNPCSTAFVPDVKAVYKEAARVLKPGGIFMTGFTNPVYHLFDIFKAEKGEFTLKYSQPYSDLESLNDEELRFFTDQNEPVVFGHSLEAFLNGQLEAGLMLTHLFEDSWGGTNPIDKHMPFSMATRAIKRS
ncbi:MAG: class I SAM-dependent methyltransferase [Bacteroidetes bacterium]|nr:class I SAM-dependent methyltransferase [Bacteroidota bacterium]MBK8876298.1 class I SAM-dependent methyltransferase [Bacteroidota bacterium]MBK9423471.1 class I SAM-dependent methyltransferase [Bacteroidota bacterium]